MGGRVDPRFTPVREAFASTLAEQRGTGAAIAIWCDGDWVVDLWGGAADAAGTVRWQPDSIVQPYSVSKPFAAVCALILVDRGLLQLDAPMQRYWPEFRAPASVRQVLSHQAGVVAIDQPVPTETFYDWERMCRLLADQPPAWPPGTAHGESALFYGHLVGEPVRRISGMSLGHFLRREVCGPLELDFIIGLTATEQHRAVDLAGLDDHFRERNAAAKPALYAQAIANPPGAQEAAVVNGSAWRAAEVPAVNGHGTARGVAGLYAALLQKKLLSPGLTREATRAQLTGPDLVFGGEKSWGLGFGVDSAGFGMGGLGGSVGWACPEGRYAFAFVTGSMGTHDRGTLLENTFRACIGLSPID